MCFCCFPCSLVDLYCFIYCSIDSTKVIGPGLGRYVNDGVASEANCRMQVMVGTPKEAPRLALYATRKLTKGEELRYNYGVPNLPWRVKQYRNSQKLCEPGESSTQQVVNEAAVNHSVEVVTEATVGHRTEVVDMATDDHRIDEQAVSEAAVNHSVDQQVVTEDLSTAFLKFEDIDGCYAPHFVKYTNFVSINVNGDLTNGIFSPVIEDNLTQEKVVVQKRQTYSGYCECCEVKFSDRKRHLQSFQHRMFYLTDQNYEKVDNVIEELNMREPGLTLMQNITASAIDSCDTDTGNTVKLANTVQLVDYSYTSSICSVDKVRVSGNAISCFCFFAACISCNLLELFV